MTDTSPLDCFPKVVPCHTQCVITLTQTQAGDRFEEGGRYRIAIYPTQELGSYDTPAESEQASINGSLKVAWTADAEQEYILVVSRYTDKEWIPAGEYRIYALEADLHARFPYKGDLHMHSSRSDGQEPPAYVAGACRKIGLDFMAVTDHRQYAPSLEAIQAFKGVAHDLQIFPGEEIHPPENAVHMINFGGKISVNALFADEAIYRSEVKLIEENCSSLPSGRLRYQYASCLWCYQKVRSSGGLAIFCHPYWIYNHSYNVPEALIAQHFADLPFDAYEIIGGYHRFEIESNRLQVARYHEERARGKNSAIVGVSDAHGCENGSLFGWYYTIVFSPSLELPDLIENIKGLYSVAVENLPGETPHTHGPFRLAQFALFLLREVFPIHDELCGEEGQLMLAHLAGTPSAEADLKQKQGRITNLYNVLWGKN